MCSNGDRMTDKRGIGDSATGTGVGRGDSAARGEGHYQPWLRNQATPGEPVRPAPLATRPAAAAPAGEPVVDTAHARDLSADDLLARPIARPVDSIAEPPPVTARLADGAGTALEWIARTNRQIDLPRRIAALELPRRGRAFADWVGRVTRKATTGVAQTTRSGIEAAAPRIEQASRAAQEALAKGASGAKAGIGSGTTKLSEATRALIASAPLGSRDREAAAPESQLDRLLAEGDAEPASPRTQRTDGLPLFAPAPPATTPAGDAGTADGAAASPAPAEPAAAPAAPATAAAAAMAQPAPPPVAPAQTATPLSGATTATGGGGFQPRPPQGSGGGGQPWHRHPGTLVLGAALLLASGFAAGLYWTGPGVDRATTERVIHDYLLNNPEILPQAMERLERNRAAQVIDRERDRIERPFSGAWAGAADGDVTMTVFTDYACTFCRASLADIDRLLREDRNLKVVFRELPILSPDSEPAARLALAAARRGRYMPMHRALFETGSPDADARRDAAVNLDVANDSAALGDAAITRELEGNIALARDLGIDGTPSWVIGDRMLTGAVGYDQLRAAISAARAGE